MKAKNTIFKIPSRLGQSLIWALAFLSLVLIVNVSQAACPNGTVLSPGGVCLQPSSQTTGIVGSKSLPDAILKVINLLLGLAGVIAVVMIVIGGFWYLTAAGNDEQNEKGKKTLFSALIGLGVIILSFTIVRILSGLLVKDKG